MITILDSLRTIRCCLYIVCVYVCVCVCVCVCAVQINGNALLAYMHALPRVFTIYI